MRFDILQGNYRRLFHYIAQVPGQGELFSFRLAQARLDKQNLASDGCPGQSRYDTGIVVVLIFVPVVFLSTQIFV